MGRMIIVQRGADVNEPFKLSETMFLGTSRMGMPSEMLLICSHADNRALLRATRKERDATRQNAAWSHDW